MSSKEHNNGVHSAVWEYPSRTTACSRLPPASARASLPLPAAAEAQRSPLRFAPGGMRELSSELLVSPPLRSGENQEFEQMPLRGTAQLAHSPLAALGENAALSRERLPSLRSGRTRRSRPMPLRGTA